jgi:hypothetical protein
MDSQRSALRTQISESTRIACDQTNLLLGFNDEAIKGCTGTRKPLPNLKSSDTHKQWGSGRDETVGVNQRALINQVLARYSGEFTRAFCKTPAEEIAVTHTYSVPRLTAKLG